MLPHPFPPPYPLAFEEQWFSNLEAADYVVVAIPFSDYFPWGSPTVSWFKQNYRLVAHYTDQFPPPPTFILGIVPTTSLYGLHPSEYVYENISSLRNSTRGQSAGDSEPAIGTGLVVGVSC